QELSSNDRNAAFCLVKLGRAAEALALHDRGKARVLSDAIGLSEARFENLPETPRSEAIAARDEIASLQDEMRRQHARSRRSGAELGTTEGSPARAFRRYL